MPRSYFKGQFNAMQDNIPVKEHKLTVFMQCLISGKVHEIQRYPSIYKEIPHELEV